MRIEIDLDEVRDKGMEFAVASGYVRAGGKFANETLPIYFGEKFRVPETFDDPYNLISECELVFDYIDDSGKFPKLKRTIYDPSYLHLMNAIENILCGGFLKNKWDTFKVDFAKIPEEVYHKFETGFLAKDFIKLLERTWKGKKPVSKNVAWYFLQNKSDKGCSSEFLTDICGGLI